MSRNSIWIIAFGLLLAGCQSADELPAAVSTAVAPSRAANNADATTSPANPDEPAAASTSAAAFDPPFPHRTDLFEPPRSGQGMVRRDEEHGETIELKGFVDVDGPQVLLAIDGVLSPIPEGGEKYGVQVISIHPPSVVLQRGRSRWTASLE